MGLAVERIRGFGAMVLVALPLALGACSTTPPQESVSGESTAPTAPVGSGAATPGPTAFGPSAAPLPIFEKMPNLSWIGEGPEGWLAGELRESYRRLPEGEIGLVAQDGWVLSIRPGKEAGIELLIRRGSTDEPKFPVLLGDLLPSSVAIAKDVAYLSGVPFAIGEDLRTYQIALGDPSEQPDPFIQPDPGNLVRNLAISADGETLASSICDVTEDFVIEGCRLQRIVDREAQTVNELPGLLTRISSGVAVVVEPVGDSEPSWVAGFDLESGKQLWQIDGQIERWRLDTGRSELVIARFEPGESPRFVIEAVALGSGDRTVLYEESGDTPPTFWTDQSTDDFLVLSSESDIGSAAAAHEDGLVPVLIIDRATGSVDPFLLSIGKAS